MLAVFFCCFASHSHVHSERESIDNGIVCLLIFNGFTVHCSNRNVGAKNEACGEGLNDHEMKEIEEAHLRLNKNKLVNEMSTICHRHTDHERRQKRSSGRRNCNRAMNLWNHTLNYSKSSVKLSMAYNLCSVRWWLLLHFWCFPGQIRVLNASQCEESIAERFICGRI